MLYIYKTFVKFNKILILAPTLIVYTKINVQSLLQWILPSPCAPVPLDLVKGGRDKKEKRGPKQFLTPPGRLT